MSTKANSALDRRSAIRVGAVGAAATAATVATASNAEAAAGQAVLQGRVNTVGTAGTTLSSSGTAITLTVKNTGPGAAAYFFGQNSNGFAGGTGAGSKYGLSAANTGSASTGAGMAASGINNTGVLANTNNSDRFAVEAVNLSATGGAEAGGLYAEGGEGVGVIAISNVGVPAALSVGDTVYFEGHELVITTGGGLLFGETSAMGPEVSFSGTVALDSNGAATYDLSGPAFDDVDLTSGVALVSANSESMPGLWVTVVGPLVQIQGGEPAGQVSFRVTGHRTDWGFLAANSARRTASGVDVAKKAAKSAKERSNRG